VNIEIQTWEIVRRVLTGIEEAESTDMTKSRSIPAGHIPKFISEIDKELKFNGS
jgi:hypothetical protein